MSCLLLFSIFLILSGIVSMKGENKDRTQSKKKKKKPQMYIRYVKLEKVGSISNLAMTYISILKLKEKLMS